MKALLLSIPVAWLVIGCAAPPTSRVYYDEAWYQSQALPQGLPEGEPHEMIVVRDGARMPVRGSGEGEVAPAREGVGGVDAQPDVIVSPAPAPALPPPPPSAPPEPQ